MPKYIDKDKLIRDLIDNRSFYPAIVKSAIENAPTADVVLRSEVEYYIKIMFEAELAKAKQEAYEEIESYMLTCIENDEKVYDKGNDEYYDGRFIGFKIIEEHLAELKKKYIGE